MTGENVRKVAVFGLGSMAYGMAQSLLCASLHAIEELEDMTRLALLTRGMNPRMLTDAQMRNVVTGFDIEWDE